MDGSTTNHSWLAVISAWYGIRENGNIIPLWLSDLPWRMENRYPLVNVYITMANHLIFHGKNHYKWWFSIVILNYQRVIIPYYNPTTIPWSHSLKSVTCGSGSKTATPCVFSTLRCHIWQPFDGSLLSSAGSKQAGGRTVAGTRDWLMSWQQFLHSIMPIRNSSQPGECHLSWDFFMDSPTWWLKISEAKSPKSPFQMHSLKEKPI